MTRFAYQFLASSANPPAENNYRTLHQASILQPAKFWRNIWGFCDLTGELGAVDYVAGQRIQDGKWFPQGRLNFAANLLRVGRLVDTDFAQSAAMIARSENGSVLVWSRQRLFSEVRALAYHFHRQGLVAGDRVAAVLPNIGESVVAMLAATALGAIWSSCSPEFGDDAICDRFGQIEPKILITSRFAQYNHKILRPLERVVSILPRLLSVKQLVVIGDQDDSTAYEANLPTQLAGLSISNWNDLIEVDDWAFDVGFGTAFLRELPFNHPLYIVYSSGTTGVPKCIVHGAGGSILQHAKEHQLHCDLRCGDKILFYTTTGWMMWNWLVSSLVSDATIVLQDGSPFAEGASTLWRVASELGVTHLGAGAKFYTAVQKEGYVPKDHFDLSCLRCLMSTGSPLLADTFDWIYSAVGSDINLASISGGTDILSCFVLGNPTLPVRRGEIQCAGLGMDVQVFDPQGRSLENEAGELVCVNSFPSMPTGFWNDPEGKKYHQAYFDRFANVWCHGDWACKSPTGGFVIYGRSDATLNPGGVRIGTAEIYQQLESFAEVQECLATSMRQAGDEQIVLFIRLIDSYDLTEDLVDRIRNRIRSRCSARHVPAIIVAAPDFPRTISGKLSEIAVRNAIAGSSLGNSGALANPQSLLFFEQWGRKQQIS